MPSAVSLLIGGFESAKGGRSVCACVRACVRGTHIYFILFYWLFVSFVYYYCAFYVRVDTVISRDGMSEVFCNRYLNGS